MKPRDVEKAVDQVVDPADVPMDPPPSAADFKVDAPGAVRIRGDRGIYLNGDRVVTGASLFTPDALGWIVLAWALGVAVGWATAVLMG